MRKSALLSAVSVLVIASSASAADLPSVKSAPAAPAPMWTGFYAGLNSGWNFGTNSSTSNANYGNDSFSIQKLQLPSPYYLPQRNYGFLTSNAIAGGQSGFMGGAQFGYNYQLKNNIVAGIETDIQASGSRGSGSSQAGWANALPPNNDGGTAYGSNLVGLNQLSVVSGLDFLGTVRGRIGYIVKPSLLVYGTAGFAYGGAWAEVSNNSLQVNNSDAASNLGRSQYAPNNSTFIGGGKNSALLAGYSAGGGVEWLFMPNWSMKMEALYWNLGNMNIASSSISNAGYSRSPATGTSVGTSNPGLILGNSNVNFQGVTARAGLNYHFSPGMAELTSASLFGFNGKSANVSENTAARANDWNGVHFGLNAGYNWGTNSAIQTNMFQSNSTYFYNANVTPPALTNPSNPSSALLPITQGQGIQSGYLGGLQLGYSRIVSQKVYVGFETDIQGATIRGGSASSGVFSNGSSGSTSQGGVITTNNWSQSGLAVTSYNSGIDYLGTVRGRLGYLINPALLIYGTGGLAYGGAWTKSQTYAASNSSIAISSDSGFAYTSALPQNYFGSGSNSALLVGYSAGGGAEWMFAPGWSVRAEALYWNLGNMNLNSASFAPGNEGSYGANPDTALSTGAWPVSNTGVIAGTSRINFQGISVRTGLNYHVDFGAAEPVIAKF